MPVGGGGGHTDTCLAGTHLNSTFVHFIPNAFASWSKNACGYLYLNPVNNLLFSILYF